MAFGYTGSEQFFDVPAGVTAIHVVLIGGHGEQYVDLSTMPGGRGARVEGDLTVVPGTRLYVAVGGSNGPTFNGGGAGLGRGGGASDIRTVARTEPGTLASRLMVAAGGGGAGIPGWGADATQTFADGVTGGAGTATAGGAGGQGEFPGQNGSLGLGGDSGREDFNNSVIGGGGGGGYYGGGGGAYSSAVFGGGGSGGGGGGSNFLGTATNTATGLDSAGIPSVTISYLAETEPTPPPPTAPPSDTGVVAAEVTVPTSAACIELSTTAVTFGTQRFGGENLVATPRITLTNCSSSPENILARGTDATGGSATWNLVDGAATCGAGTLAINDYHLKLRREDSGEDVQLSKDNRALLGIAPGADQRVDAVMDMPCPGSSGAGETMGMQIVFVVTE